VIGGGTIQRFFNNVLVLTLGLVEYKRWDTKGIGEGHQFPIFGAWSGYNPANVRECEQPAFVLAL
jgi:hypothetical protein